MLNQHSPIPLYLQIAERIRTHVQQGVFAVGDKIPSENQLASQYTVGRPTVRQATDLLIREGLLQRRRGSGTYVVPKTQPIDLFSLTGTHATLQHTDLNTDIELLGPVTRLTDTHLIPTVFNNSVYHLTRRTRIANTPVLLESIYLDAELFHDFERQSLQDKSLSNIVRNIYYLEASSADQTFTIELASEQRAEQLDIAIKTPLLLVKRLLHFGEHHAAIYCDIYCRTDQFQFSQTLTRERDL